MNLLLIIPESQFLPWFLSFHFLYISTIELLLVAINAYIYYYNIYFKVVCLKLYVLITGHTGKK